MNADLSTGQATGQPGKTVSNQKMLVRVVVAALITAAALFIPAGRLGWVWAWVYLGVYVSAGLFSTFVAASKYPDLIDERIEAPQDAKKWDRLLSTVLILLTLLVPLPIAGLDARFGWSPPLPLALHLVAVVLWVLGYALAAWAMMSNRFYSRVVRIQKDRGHVPVTGGPYRYVRHPGYVGNIVNMFSLPLILGSLWALVPGVVAAIGLVVRTALEDRTLREELPGYAEYAQRTRYRLLPGVW